ncbi:outer membrane receptor protein [Caulobacter sp. AP07]|uniref:TonB-dependent receptor n=1 Tax=Caulobacter sp. AP07 TaxID=1144304 RepID=UPI000271ED64|nr:TonB-dependent receptor [Caulobacter sp. AP07]EJL35871.1 outer membrane receptor protein [Caulobacter sp. AP07]
MRYRLILLSGAALFAATTASAQTAVADQATVQLETVVVTADFRATNIQNLPLAVSSVSATDLQQQNINTASKIQNVVPGLKILEVGAQPGIFIRGVGSVVANVLNDPAAAYNVDGVAVSRPIGMNGLFFDLDRVEVVKGPQGTLYGRNATVGAINVISKNPTFDFGGSAGVTLGDFNLLRLEGVVNIPVNETLAFRAGFQREKRDPYLTSGSDDADNVGVRVKGIYKPNEDLTVLVTGSYYNAQGAGVGDVPLKSPTGDFLFPSDPWRVDEGPSLLNGGTRVPRDAWQDLTTRGLSAQIDWRLGFAKLTLIPAFLGAKYDALTYSGGFRQRVTSKADQKSLEARLASSEPAFGRLEWTLGALYLLDQQVSRNDQKTQIPTRSIQVLDPLDLRSWALYGQGVWSANDRLRFTLGLRYSRDKKTMRGTTTSVSDVPGDPVLSQYANIGDAQWESTDYRVGVDYDLAPDSLLYANISSGYKAGGFFVGRAPNTYEPETMTSYQVGSKNRFFDRRFQLNLEAWYWDYRNFQVSQFGFVNGVTPRQSPANIAFMTVNAPKAKNWGLEVQSAWMITPHDRLSVQLQYNVARYVEFTQAAFAPTNVPAANYAGEDLTRAPMWSGNLGYSHSFELPNDARVVASLSQQFESHSYIVLQRIPGRLKSGFATTDFDVTYHAPEDRWQISIYGNNLENEPVLLFAGNTPAGLWGHARAPRNFGVTLRAQF